jgi:hypothetical protein
MNIKLKLLATLVAATLTSACGDTKHKLTPVDTKTNQEQPDNSGSTGGGHDHHEVSKEGRLVVSTFDSNVLSIISAEDGEHLDSIGITGYPQSLRATEHHRYVMAVQRNAGLVEFIDGGVWQENHGDHLHPYEQAPSLVDFTLQGVKPTHVNSGQESTVVFFDGDKDTAENAKVIMFNESNIANNNRNFATLDYNTYQHGAMQTVGEYLVSTIRDEQSGSTLPSQIGLFHSHGDHFDQDKVFDVACPSLHGSAQSSELVAFACADGVVVINTHDNVFSQEKIMNPAEFVEGERIGMLRGHPEKDLFIGSSHAGVYAIDPSNRSVEKIEWQASEDAWLSSAYFSAEGEHVVLMDSAGVISVFEGHAHDDEFHWELAHNLTVTTSDLAQMPEQHGFTMTLSQSQQVAYVTDPINQHIIAIDLESGELAKTFELDVVPKNVVWLGIAGEAHEHQH